MLFSLGGVFSLLLAGGAILLANQNVKEVGASFDSYQHTLMSRVNPVEEQQLDEDNIFYDDFDSGLNYSTWAISERKWGNEYNSGVRHENVFYNSEDKTMTFRALGEYYSKDEFYNDNEDAFTSNGTYTGGVLVSREEFGPGRYEVKMRLANAQGICSAFWLYGMDEEKYTEIDIEFPNYYYDSTYYANRYRFDQMICSTYDGPNEETQKTSEAATLAAYMNDNEYHEYAFEWYRTSEFQAIRWYVDGHYVKSLYTHIPNYTARLWVGCWVPNNQWFCGEAKFDEAYMDVDWVKYTPFKNQDFEEMGSTLSDFYDVDDPIDRAFLKRNMLPNDGFETDNLAGYDANSSSVLIIDSAAKSGSYGLLVKGEGGGNSYAETSFLAEGLGKLKVSFDAKGWGAIYVNVKDMEGNILNEEGDANLVYNNSSPSEFSSYSIDLVVPTDAYQISFSVNSESEDVGISVDNAYIGYLSSKMNDGDSYGMASKLVNDEPRWVSNQSLNLTGEAGRTWKLGFGNPKYAWNSDIDTVLLGESSAVSDPDGSNPVYSAISATMAANELFNIDESTHDRWPTTVFVQEFDMTYFKDIEFGFYSLPGYENWRSLNILYSIDSGVSWKVLLHQGAGNLMPQSDDAYKYVMKADASNINEAYSTIRFAFIASINPGGDGYRLTSVIINNRNDIMNNLDYDDVCHVSQNYMDFIEHEYENLSFEDLGAFNDEFMDTPYLQTYEEGYNYLLGYWASLNNSQRIATTFFDSSTGGLIIVVVVSAFILSTSLLVILKKKHKRI